MLKIKKKKAVLKWPALKIIPEEEKKLEIGRGELTDK